MPSQRSAGGQAGKAGEGGLDESALGPQESLRHRAPLLLRYRGSPVSSSGELKCLLTHIQSIIDYALCIRRSDQFFQKVKLLFYKQKGYPFCQTDRRVSENFFTVNCAEK